MWPACKISSPFNSTAQLHSSMGTLALPVLPVSLASSAHASVLLLLLLLLLQTNVPGVYAIGDVASFPLLFAGGASVRQEHVTHARSSAAQAAQAIRGKQGCELFAFCAIEPCACAYDTCLKHMPKTHAAQVICHPRPPQARSTPTPYVTPCFYIPGSTQAKLNLNLATLCVLHLMLPPLRSQPHPLRLHPLLLQPRILPQLAILRLIRRCRRSHHLGRCHPSNSSSSSSSGWCRG